MGRKKTKLSAKLIVLLFLVSLGWFAISFIIGLVKENLVETQVLKFEPLKEVVSTTGYLVREEKIIYSVTKGKLKKLQGEGARVRAGMVVSEVLAPSLETSTGQASKKLVAQSPGLVSYRMDGLEKLFAADNWDKLRPKTILELEEEEQKETTEQAQVEQGKPLVKIVDNLAPGYIYMQVEEKVLGTNSFAENDLIEFALKNKEAKGFQDGILGRVSKTKLEDGYVQFLITTRKLNELALFNRKLEVEIIKNKYEGFVVPKDSIVVLDGKNGVYLVYKQVVHWVPVQVVGTVGDKVAVKNVKEKTSLKENMEIIVNPGLAKEGQRVK